MRGLAAWTLAIAACSLSTDLDRIASVPCPDGFADCDADASNGCEVELAKNRMNCGACAAACPDTPGGVPECSAGICTVDCDADHADCNADAADGCEVTLDSDSSNCGGCNIDCAGGTCSDRTCGPRVLDDVPSEALAGVAVNAQYVFWTSVDGNEVRRTTRNVGAPIDVLAAGITAGVEQPQQIVATADFLVWVNFGGAVLRLPITADGGGSVTPTLLAKDKTGPLGVAVRQDTVYWTNLPQGTVSSVSLDGGTVTTLAKLEDEKCAGITTDGEYVYWTTRVTGDDFGGSVFRIPLGGGERERIAGVQGAPTGIVTHEGTLFWTADFLKAIKHAPLADPFRFETLLPTNEVPFAISVFQGLLFWNERNGDVFRAESDGTSPTLLAAGPPDPRLMAVDAHGVYWVTQNGQLLHLPLVFD